MAGSVRVSGNQFHIAEPATEKNKDRAGDYKQTVQGPSTDTHHTPALSRAA